MILVQQFRAPNDVNGNPRRLWLVYETTYHVEIVGSDYQRDVNVKVTAYDEGYVGRRVLLDHGFETFKHPAELPDVEVSATEYKRLLKAYPR